MKEQKLIEMNNKVEAIGRVLQTIIAELEQLKTLAVGNMTLTKKLPGYEEAFNQLKQEQDEQKENTDGPTTGDSGSIVTNE